MDRFVAAVCGHRNAGTMRCWLEHNSCDSIAALIPVLGLITATFLTLPAYAHESEAHKSQSEHQFDLRLDIGGGAFVTPLQSTPDPTFDYKALTIGLHAGIPLNHWFDWTVGLRTNVEVAGSPCDTGKMECEGEDLDRSWDMAVAGGFRVHTQGRYRAFIGPQLSLNYGQGVGEEGSHNHYVNENYFLVMTLVEFGVTIDVVNQWSVELSGLLAFAFNEYKGDAEEPLGPGVRQMTGHIGATYRF